jgi:hypothetical protein
VPVVGQGDNNMQRECLSRSGGLRPTAVVAVLLLAGACPARAASLDLAPYDPDTSGIRSGPIALGSGVGLVLSLGVHYPYGDDPARGEGTLLGYTEGETALRLGVRNPGFNLGGSMQLGERLELDGGVELARDSLVGMAGLARLNLTYRW